MLGDLVERRSTSGSPARARSATQRRRRASRCARPGSRRGGRSPPALRASRGIRGRRSGTLAVERAHRDVADLAGEAVGAGEDRPVDDHARRRCRRCRRSGARAGRRAARRSRAPRARRGWRRCRPGSRTTGCRAPRAGTPRPGARSQPRFGRGSSVPVSASTVPGSETPAPIGVRPSARTRRAPRPRARRASRRRAPACSRDCRARRCCGSARRRAGRTRRRPGSRR